MVRGLDHVVHVVKDLDAAARSYEALGFNVTPTAHHPWGTSNRLVQLDHFFIEILTVRDQGLIPEHGEASFSFGAHCRDFLEKQEGAAMLVLESAGPAADRKAFDDLGLAVYDPFSFQREATFGDGTKANVGFDLTFTSTPLAPDLGFFTCFHRYPDVFWRSEFQAHPNGVNNIVELVMVAKDPSDLHEFLGGFTGQREMRATSLGLEIATPRGLVTVLSPSAFDALYEDAVPIDLPDGRPVIAGVVVGNSTGTVEKTGKISQIAGMMVAHRG